MNKLKSNEREIIQLVRQGKQTIFEFMEYIKVNRSTMNTYTKNLVRRGFLIQTSIQPRGYTNHNVYDLSRELRGIKVIKND